MEEKRRTSKKYFRCHAHTNPFRDKNIEHPATPSDVNWLLHFSDGEGPKNIDIGCGYGRFLFSLAEMLPNENSCGLEMRDKVVEYVKMRTKDMVNCSVIKTNALLFLPNFFEKGSLMRIFVLFPDPHFKKRKQKGRVVCRQTVPIFRYLLEKSGLLYISTDVKELFEEMSKTVEESGCFEHYKEAECDEVYEKCYKDTNEAHRAGVKSGHTYGRVYRVINE